MSHELTAVVYHYVRDAARSRFPRIRGIGLYNFRQQVAELQGMYEMATLESALAYLAGDYQPTRGLCLLTFDDGLKEHAAQVTPILADANIQGLFFLSTGCQAGRVLPVHKNHLLTALLDFKQYRSEFLEEYRKISPDADMAVDTKRACAIYRWDEPEQACFKYLLNYQMSAEIRNDILHVLFCRHLGDEAAMAREFYLDWQEACAMQDAGMILGGHSHAHTALATMSESEQKADLTMCATQLRASTKTQSLWPFSYPYGTPAETFDEATITIIRNLGFCCAFSTEVGTNQVGQPLYALRRIDTNDLKPHGQRSSSPRGLMQPAEKE
jgi:peptidoglycan/xylan/chitin deacetylase (PgdA/CDA1 family)